MASEYALPLALWPSVTMARLAASGGRLTWTTISLELGIGDLISERCSNIKRGEAHFTPHQQRAGQQAAQRGQQTGY
jgi:hypothetical protein